MLPDLLAAPSCLTIGGRVFAADVAASLEERLVRLVAERIGPEPLEVGVSLQEVRSRASARPLSSSTPCSRRPPRTAASSPAAASCAPPAGAPRLTEAQRRALAEIEETIRVAGNEPPAVSELVPRFGVEVGDLLRLLEREGRVVAVEPERYYAAASVDALVERLRADMMAGREYSPAELRELLGFSRKFLIPFLEYCDRRGFTTRGATGRSWHGT